MVPDKDKFLSRSFSMTSQTLKWLTNIAILAGLCATTNQAHAFIAGGKAMGMAATGIAYPQDAYAGAFNPAGAVEIEDRLDLGFAWVREHGHADVKVANPPPIPGVSGRFNAFSQPNAYNGDFGINKNFCSNICGQDWQWSAGLVVYNRDFQKTTYNKALPLLGTSKLGLEYLHEIISPLVSLRINESHTIGVSLDVNVRRIKVNGLQQFSNPLFSISPTHVTNKGYDYSGGVGATFGWKWEAYDHLTFGVTYRTKVKMSRLKKYKGFLAQEGRLNSPERWGVGLAYQFMPCATFTFDFEWINWQSIQALHNPLLHKGNLEQLGSANGPGFGFRNQALYRFGVDYAVNENWTVRAGFRHANAIFKKKSTTVNLLTCDTVKNFVTLGATYAWNACNEITMFYAHGFENKIKGRNSIPPMFGSGDVNLTESKDVLGISWGYRY